MVSSCDGILGGGKYVWNEKGILPRLLAGIAIVDAQESETLEGQDRQAGQTARDSSLTTAPDYSHIHLIQ